MPLFKGKSKAKFSHNVKEEMDAGKPQKQALAIAYKMKRKAHGGMVNPYSKEERHGNEISGPAQGPYGQEDCEHGGPTMCAMGCYADGGDISKGFNGALGMPGIQSSIKNLTGKPKMYAKGGSVEDAREKQTGVNMPVHTGRYGAGTSAAGVEAKRGNVQAARGMHKDTLDELRAMKGPHGNYADGGMIDRVMKRGGYSEGGKVANEDEIEAGFMPNEFDDLHLRDDLESSYTGANSGDELSSPGEDERRRDMVDRIMLKRRKQTNPRPA